MFKSKKNIAILAMVVVISTILYFQGNPNEANESTERLLTSYTTTTTRTASVNSFCAGKTRSTLIDTSQASAYTLYSSQMQSMFTLNG